MVRVYGIVQVIFNPSLVWGLSIIIFLCVLVYSPCLSLTDVSHSSKYPKNSSSNH